MEHEGANGLEATRTFGPDLILLDVIMPDMDGPTLARQIKADEELKNTRVICLTATVLSAESDADADSAPSKAIRPYQARGHPSNHRFY